MKKVISASICLYRLALLAFSEDAEILGPSVSRPVDRRSLQARERLVPWLRNRGRRVCPRQMPVQLSDGVVELLPILRPFT